jgi:hypothetical protein
VDSPCANRDFTVKTPCFYGKNTVFLRFRVTAVF